MQYPFEFQNYFYFTTKTNPVNIYLKILMKNKLIFFKVVFKMSKNQSKIILQIMFCAFKVLLEKVGTRGSEYWMPEIRIHQNDKF